MKTDFRILLISTDPYHLGLLKGYCHAHHYNVLETTADLESLGAIIERQPNIIFLAENLTPKIDSNSIREISINHQIPVCYLRDINNRVPAEEGLAYWVDAILEAPLEVEQLSDYLHKKFKLHPCFIQEKRNGARRAANDRRQSLLDQQSITTKNSQPTNDHSPKSCDAECFLVEPFHIDQRSKCVRKNGKSLNLTRKEFDLFELLAQDVERVFMCDEIINHVWPENNRVTKSDLYQYMHLLRKKVEIDPNNPSWILTVKGFGYKLNVTDFAPINPPDLCEKEEVR